MSKSTELATAVDDLRYATQQLIVIGDALVTLLSDDPEFVAALPEPTILKPAAGTSPAAPASAPQVEEVSFEHLRGTFANLSKSGLTSEIRNLLVKHGAPRLSEIDRANYAALLADAKALGARHE